MTKPNSPNGDYIMHGMMSSYFTKKLEAYFLAKGISYRFVEMDTPDHVQCGQQVGVMQFPQLQCPDGTWLTDTTPIIEHFESDGSRPSLRPGNALTAFCSYFLEDSFDEWLWAPALYFRWAFKMDSKRRSEEFSHSLLSNGVRLPRFVLKLFVTRRQQHTHIRDNGIVSPAHARHTENLYLDVLDLLQPVLAKRPYLFGNRPCEADFGLFGPMFPHFGCDPTPQEIMHVRAPHLFRWLGRLWSTRPDEVRAQPELADLPEDLKPILQKMAGEYLPYLVENQKAFEAGEATTHYVLGDLKWEVKTAPYRVYCLAQLQQRFQALNDENRQKCHHLLGENAVEILSRPVYCPPEMRNVTASQPAKGVPEQVVGRLWQSKGDVIEGLMEFLVRNRKTQAQQEIKREGSSWLPVYFRRYRAAGED